MDKVKKWKCSECGFPASNAGIVRAHQGRIHHGFGTIEHNDTQVIDMTTERPDGTRGELESPKGSPAEALQKQIEKAGLVAHIPYPDGYKWSVTIPTDELMELVTAYAATVAQEITGDDDVATLKRAIVSIVPDVHAKRYEAMTRVNRLVATVEREAERTTFLTATTWATKYPEADKVWHEMLTDAALQGPIQGDSNTSEEASSTQ